MDILLLYRLTVDEIVAILEEEDKFLDAEIVLEPPENAALSDEDSGPEDVEGDISRLTGNQLRGTAELRVRKIISDGVVEVNIGENATQLSPTTSSITTKHDAPTTSAQSNHTSARKPVKKQLPPKREWKQEDITYKRERTWDQPEWLNKDISALELFEIYFDGEVMDFITTCTTQYAKEKGNDIFQITVGDLKVFLGILFLSGYNTMSRYRMYWELSSDTHHPGIARAISRNKFTDILKFFHVCDNSRLDTSDKFAKIRPLWSMLNERFLNAFPMDSNLCVDESMVPYFGRHSTKQHIHGKPVRFGYKVWCLCSRLGYMIQSEPYQGACTGNTNPELGVGGSVVCDLMRELPCDHTYSIYFDNFFTSLRLLEALKKEGHDGTGTIRGNRVENAPLLEACVMKKKPRGSYHQVTDSNSGTTVVQYNDNNVVIMASNRAGVNPQGTARRWSHAEKKKITVSQPACVISYNTYMGGVDRMDQNIAAYRINIRNRKWYWPLIAYLLNCSMNNAWLLYRLTPRGKADGLDLLGFTRSIVKVYLEANVPNHPPKNIQKAKGKRRVPDQVRLDGKEHILATSNTQIRCALCSKNTWKRCKKCDVGCHIKCFEGFHYNK